MSRILLVFDLKGNREVVADELGGDHEVVRARSDDAVDAEGWDLCAIETAPLGRVWKRLRARKQAERPRILPVLAVAPARQVRRIPAEVRTSIDEIAAIPVDRTLLRARVEALLQTRRLSVELLERAEAAERATRMRDEVLAVVAHDLRNPLHTIAASADLLELPLSDEEREQQVGTIRRSADRMNGLIEDLLDIARIEAGQLRIESAPMDAATLAREAYDLHRPIARDGALDLECELQRDLPRVEADADRTEQVFANLISNAVKFTPEGGRITIRAERAEGNVRFSVSDTGPGIPEEKRDELFRPFWEQSADREVGTGLGLAISNGIIEAHGGRIGVESEPGEGSTFWFTLPVADNGG